MSMTAAGNNKSTFRTSNGGNTNSKERTDVSSPSPADRLKHSEMALEALANIMKHNKGKLFKNVGNFPIIQLNSKIHTSLHM